MTFLPPVSPCAGVPHTAPGDISFGLPLGLERQAHLSWLLPPLYPDSPIPAGAGVAAAGGTVSFTSPFPCFGALLSGWLTPCVYKQTLSNRQGKQHLHAGAAMWAPRQARRLLGCPCAVGGRRCCVPRPLFQWLTHVLAWCSLPSLGLRKGALGLTTVVSLCRSCFCPGRSVPVLLWAWPHVGSG